MDIRNIIPMSKDEYAVKKKEDLCILSLFASVGTKALCLEDKKTYLQTDKNEWVSI